MYACPACLRRTISFFRKWLSYPAIPAHCKQCDSYFFSHRASGGVGVVVSAIVITLCGFMTAALMSPWPLLLGVAASVVFYVWHWHSVKLEPLSPEAVAAARKAEGMFGAAWLLLMIFN
jgi:hypothetical protein